MFHLKRFLLIFSILFGFLTDIYPDDGDAADSTGAYFQDLTDLLTLRLYTLTKFNSLEIINPTGRMIMRPNGNTNLGIGFNYKSFGLGLAFGRPLSKESTDKYGLTNRFDMKASF